MLKTIGTSASAIQWDKRPIPAIIFSISKEYISPNGVTPLELGREIDITSKNKIKTKHNNLAIFTVLSGFIASIFFAASGSAAASPPKDRSLAALEALAAKGSARAQYELAMRYEGGGGGLAKDTRRALVLYCQAAAQDHADAAYRVGKLHMVGGSGFPADRTLSRQWIARAAESGSERAQAEIGTTSGTARKPTRCAPPERAAYAARRAPKAVQSMVVRMAPRYKLDPNLVLAVIAVESDFRADIVSNKNAMGLMQLIPETAARFGVRDPFDAEDNLRGGMKYLRWLLAYFDGDVTLALAAYNAGEGAVRQHKGVPPYRETRGYVEKIGQIYPHKSHPFDRKASASSGLSIARSAQVAELPASGSASAP